MLKRLALALLALSAAACATDASNGQYFGKTTPPDGQVLRYVSGSEPESLDPPISSGQPEMRIYMALFEGLTEMDPKTAQPIPGIAERWEANGDNTAFTFHIRNNARWSNGEPILAADFVYSIRRGLDPVLASRSAYMAWDIVNAQAYNEGGAFVQDPATQAYVSDPEKPGARLVLPGDPQERAKAITSRKLDALTRDKVFSPVKAEDVGVEAVDDHTLVLHLSHPVPFVAGLVTHQFFRPVHRKTVEAFGDAWTRPEHIVTSGAFHLKTWRPYDTLVVVRSPTYWDAANVHLDQISFYPLEDNTTIMNLYKAGQVDAVLNHTVPVAWIDRLRTYKDYMDQPELANEYYQINTTRPPMNDVRVRKAFNMAVDKDALARFKRTAKPMTSFVPAGLFEKYPQPTGDAFDPQKARQLLVDAGYKNSAGEFDPSRFPVDTVSLTYNTNENNKAVAEFVQAQWKQNLNITVPLKNMEWKTFLDTRAKLDYKGFSRSGWVGDYMDPFTFLNLFSTIAGDNGTGWWDKTYADMLIAANTEPDPKKRYELMARAERILLDVQPVIPLYSNSTNWVKKPYVKGMYANPVTLHAWKFVYIEHDPSKWGSE